jgi:hypothetical protein
MVKPARTVPRRLQRGQSMVEYAIVGGVLVSALFVADYDGQTIAEFLVNMIRLFFRNMTYFVSLP